MNGGNHWCILRTSGGKTLALAASLSAAGFEVWTPEGLQTRRRPRSNSTVQRAMAIAPTFVFARMEHLPELVALRDSLGNPHPPFSLFRHAGRIPLVADTDISGLRSAEDRARLSERKSKRRKLVMGQRVSFSDGAFGGMSGIVQEQSGSYALVAFGGGMTIKIASWLFDQDDIQDCSSHLGAAA